MDLTNLGVVLVLISAFGYASNWLNGRYLNSTLTRLLYYLGAVVHETSHAILCILTGARIREFVIFSRQPHVTHGEPAIPVIGQFLVSVAPLAGGMLFLYAVNAYLLGGYFSVPPVASWSDIPRGALALIMELKPWQWQSWAMIVLFLNVGAMIGPSTQDLKNIWPVILVLFLIHAPVLVALGFLALSLILVDIAIQLALIVALATVRVVRERLA